MFVFLFIGLAVGTSVIHGANETSCEPRATQKSTSKILADLRREMQKEGIGVYVIFSDDEHGSEYTQFYDRRRDWITGFRGSAGTAVVSQRAAALWTDGRYFTQAEEQLDCANWLLMRDGTLDVPTLVNWLVAEANATALSPGTTTVFTSSSWWTSVNTALKPIGKQLQSVDDLINRIWPSNERPSPSQQPIVIHDEQYAGESVAQKLNRTVTELRRLSATTTVISALDEVAWQFNLRGADIPYNPFFKSYAIIHSDFPTKQPELFLNLVQFNRSQFSANVTVSDYSTFWTRLNATASDPSVKRIWISPRASQAILGSIPNEKIIQPLMNSPVQRIKARKNPVERKGMRDCQVRDAVARVKHLGWIEEQLNQGNMINETQASERLIIYQQQQDRFVFPSFWSISASGDRAAVIHYSPESATARRITKDQIYLLDAGGQYLDCTTDITRTHHFGTPKELEKRAYTRVLQGVLAIADAVFPVGTYGRSIDHLGRMYLFRDGMTFGHTVGHGIGHYLSVHEGPQRIASSYNQYEEPLAEGMFLSDEPGFYKAGDFGIRIEDDMEVIVANRSAYDNTQFLHFDTITLVPYERSLIDVSLLTNAQRQAIDAYHEKVARVLEPYLRDDPAALNALRARTARLDIPSPSNNRALMASNSSIALVFLLLFIRMF